MKRCSTQAVSKLVLAGQDDKSTADYLCLHVPWQGTFTGSTAASGTRSGLTWNVLTLRDGVTSHVPQPRLSGRDCRRLPRSTGVVRARARGTVPAALHDRARKEKHVFERRATAVAALTLAKVEAQ